MRQAPPGAGGGSGIASLSRRLADHHIGINMIDNPDQLERLLPKLQAALPLPARITPELAATLLENRPAAEIKSACSVTWISYAGDEGGIMCKLSFGNESEHGVFTSITHLRFDPRLPLSREIAAYQKHRVKRLAQQPW